MTRRWQSSIQKCRNARLKITDIKNKYGSKESIIDQIQKRNISESMYYELKNVLQQLKRAEKNIRK